MKVLIIGLGSIAKKHIKALRELEPDVQIVALRSNPDSETVQGVKNIYDWESVDSETDFIIISNPTKLHFQTLQDVLKFKLPLFVEKPPFHALDNTDSLIEQIEEEGIPTYTGFNMRFLPVLQWLRKEVDQKRVIEVQVYCGSYLPDWRPGRDYRKIYSSREEMGGGVHLDLIHELDYTRWIFGEPENVQSNLFKISDLEINSVDCAFYLLQYRNMITTILLNYYRKDAKRDVEIVFDDDTWHANILKGTVTDMNGEILYKSEVTIADTYKLQMQYFLNMLTKKERIMNDLRESTKTLRYCLQGI